MARPLKATGWLLLFGGCTCVAGGALLGVALTQRGQVLWREPGSQAVAATIAASVPSFRHVVELVEPAVVTVRAQLPTAAGQAVEVDAGALAGVEADAEALSVAPVRSEPLQPGTPGAAAALPPAPQSGWRNGSGFVLNERGLILTSRHVVVDSVSIEVIIARHGRKRADLVGEDPATDLALLRLVEPPADLPCVALGDSEQLRAGDWIVAVGNPFGFSRTVTAGVVSFVGRHLPHSDFGVTSDFLQISAPVNPGSSGCPVLDLDGRVVGVTTQVAAAAQGISFAVPSRSIRWAVDAMQKQPDGRVHRGYLGIEFASLAGVDDEGRPRKGAVIVAVVAGKPADRAGLRTGDVVLGVDGAPVQDAKQLHERIVCADPGSSIALQLLRDGHIQPPIVAVLGEIGGRERGTLPN